MDKPRSTVNGLWSMVCFVGVAARVESLRGGWASPRRRWRGCLRVCWRRRFREKYRPRIFHEYSNGWRDIRAFVVPFVDGCLCVGRVAAGVEGLFESLLAQSFDGE